MDPWQWYRHTGCMQALLVAVLVALVVGCGAQPLPRAEDPAAAPTDGRCLLQVDRLSLIDPAFTAADVWLNDFAARDHGARACDGPRDAHGRTVFPPLRDVTIQTYATKTRIGSWREDWPLCSTSDLVLTSVPLWWIPFSVTLSVHLGLPQLQQCWGEAQIQVTDPQDCHQDRVWVQIRCQKLDPITGHSAE